MQEDVLWETDAVVRHPVISPPPRYYTGAIRQEHGGHAVSSQSNQETHDQDFIEITSPDGRLRSVYDKEADVAYVQLREHRYDHGELVDGNNKILEFDPEGQVHAIQFLNCSDGVTMNDVSQELHEEATRTLERLGIMVRGENH